MDEDEFNRETARTYDVKRVAAAAAVVRRIMEMAGRTAERADARKRVEVKQRPKVKRDRGVRLVETNKVRIAADSEVRHGGLGR